MAAESVTEVEGQLLYVQYLTDNGQQETSAAVLVNDGSATFVILLDDQGFQRPGFDPIPFPFEEGSPFSIVDGDNSIVPYDEAADQRSNLDASEETGDLESRDADDSRFVEVRQKRKYRKKSIRLEADDDEYYYGRDTEESYLQIHDDLLLSCESFESPYLTDEVEMEQFPEGKKISLLTTKMHAAESVKPRKHEVAYEAGHEFPRKRTNEKVRKLNLTDTTIRMMRDNACKRPRDEAGRFIPGENQRKKKQAENAQRRGRTPSKATPTPKRSGKLKLNEDALFYAIQRASGKDSDKKSDSEGVTVKAESDEEAEEEDASVPYGNGVNSYSLSGMQTDGADDSLLSQPSADNNTLPQTDGAAWFSDDSLPAFTDSVSNKAAVCNGLSLAACSAHGVSDKSADQEMAASVSTSNSKDAGCLWQGVRVSEDVLRDLRKKELKIVLKKVDITSAFSKSDTALSVHSEIETFFERSKRLFNGDNQSHVKVPQQQASLHSMTVTVGNRRSVSVDETVFPLSRLTSTASQSVLITNKTTKRLSTSTTHTASKRQAMADTTQPDKLTLTFFPDMTAPNTDIGNNSDNSGVN